MKNPKKHSYSRTKTFARICERRYAYECFEPWAGNAATARGSAVHDALESVCAAMGEGIKAQEALDLVLAETERLPSNEHITPEEVAHYLRRAGAVLEHVRPVKGLVEAWFELDLGGACPYIGKVDVISSRRPTFGFDRQANGSTEELCVLDWKTTSNPSRIRSPREAKTSIQLAGYCLAASELLGEPVRSAGFLYLLPEGPPQGVTVSFTEQEIGVAERWLRGTIGVIDKRWEAAIFKGPDGKDVIDFEQFALAEPGHWLCNKKWCPFWDKCFGQKGK